MGSCTQQSIKWKCAIITKITFLFSFECSSQTTKHYIVSPERLSSFSVLEDVECYDDVALQSVEYSYNEDQQQQPAYSSDSLTNVSVVIQNGEESAPKADYSSMPLLAGPPQVGQKIAFKLLELTENYTPEVSEYKEAKIVSFDPASKQIELELLTASQAPVEPGKFDLVYQNADGSEVVEYAVDRSSWVTERWDSLLEPRLII